MEHVFATIGLWFVFICVIMLIMIFIRIGFIYCGDKCGSHTKVEDEIHNIVQEV